MFPGIFWFLWKNRAQQEIALCTINVDTAGRVYQEIYIFTAHLPTNKYFQMKCLPWCSPVFRIAKPVKRITFCFSACRQTRHTNTGQRTYSRSHRSSFAGHYSQQQRVAWHFCQRGTVVYHTVRLQSFGCWVNRHCTIVLNLLCYTAA